MMLFFGRILPQALLQRSLHARQAEILKLCRTPKKNDAVQAREDTALDNLLRSCSGLCMSAMLGGHFPRPVSGWPPMSP